MSILIENAAPHLGQAITDVYGRKVGIVVAFFSDVDGKVTAVEVMVNDGIYETIPAERLEHGADGLKLIPEWLAEAKKIERKLDVFKKRFKAMEELFKKNQIPLHAYRELKERLAKELEKLKVEVKNVRELLKRRSYELENFVIHIEKAMTHLLISYTAGELPENGFKVSADLLRFARQAALEERKDIDRHTSIIDRLEQELNTTVAPVQEGATEHPATVPQGSAPIPVKVVS